MIKRLIILGIFALGIAALCVFLPEVTPNLAFSALALLVALLALWLVSLKMRDASIIDIFWGTGFAIVALVCLILADARTPYIFLLAAMPILWGARLSLYLAKRNLGPGHGEDSRYIAMRERSGLEEMAWRKRAFFTIYLGQGFLILLVSAPIWVAMATGYDNSALEWASKNNLIGDNATEVFVPASAKQTVIGLLSIIGAALWLIGFLFEAIGDAQLAAFIKKNKDYDGPYETKPVMDKGLWKYTRHPNYFGNACMWWGIWLAACQAPWGWVTIFGPLIMTFLLTRVSGRDLLERKLKTRPAYAKYVEHTSGFFPLPPKKG